MAREKLRLDAMKDQRKVAFETVKRVDKLIETDVQVAMADLERDVKAEKEAYLELLKQ